MWTYQWEANSLIIWIISTVICHYTTELKCVILLLMLLFFSTVTTYTGSCMKDASHKWIANVLSLIWWCFLWGDIWYFRKESPVCVLFVYVFPDVFRTLWILSVWQASVVCFMDVPLFYIWLETNNMRKKQNILALTLCLESLYFKCILNT